jgi:hypothetical protein
MWEIPDETIDIDGKPMPRAISGTYTLSLGEKASLRKMLEGWRGRVFTELELKGFDLGNVLGAPCMLGIIQEPREDKVYARISTVSKIPKGIPAPTGTINKQIYFDLTDPGALDAVEALPEWVKEKVKKSTTYLELKVPKGQSLGANED